MSDSTKYVNAYIDNAIGMLHEYITLLLQSKSQLRVANDLVSEKDKVITSLQTELEKNKNTAAEKNTAVEKAQKLEVEYNALKNKVSHMDTLVHQMNDLKKTLQNKTDEYNKMIVEKDANYNAMVSQKDTNYNKMIAEKDSYYNKMLADREDNYNKTFEEKEAAYNVTLSQKLTEIEKLTKKIADLQSQRKTINRKKPIEATTEIKTAPIEVKAVMGEAPTNFSVMVPVVEENKEPTKETDDF